jgi:glutamine amidotransferase
MCRLLGVVSSERTDFRLSLHEAPRSLRTLSQEHPDGWGLAVYEPTEGWRVHKGALCAHSDDRFHQAAAGSRGVTLLAHVRKRTVGAVCMDNTHPFTRDRWVFAHNGTIEDLAFLRERISERRLQEVRGDTDSELLFAFLLSRLDEAEVAVDAPVEKIDAVLRDSAKTLHTRPGLGACCFLLSDGDNLYVHRLGRTLYWLERAPGDAVRTVRGPDEDGAVLETPWSSGRHAILVASEELTDEPWVALGEPSLIRLSRSPLPSKHVLF